GTGGRTRASGGRGGGRHMSRTRCRVRRPSREGPAAWTAPARVERRESVRGRLQLGLTNGTVALTDGGSTGATVLPSRVRTGDSSSNQLRGAGCPQKVWRRGSLTF